MINDYNILKLKNNSLGKEKFGVVNNNNEIILPFIFEEIKVIGRCYALKLNGKWGLLTSNRVSAIYNNFSNKIVTCQSQNDSMPYYLFFDTETTGVPRCYSAPISDLHNWPRLVQLSWILCGKDGSEVSFGNDIIYPNGFIIPSDASDVHGITTEIAMHRGIDISDALHKFIVSANNALYLVGHNVSFDINIVGAELLRADINYNILLKPKVDTMLKSINYCAVPNQYPQGDKYKWPKLQELHKKLFGYEFEDAHDAMADIRATKKCFFEMKRIGLITE